MRKTTLTLNGSVAQEMREGMHEHSKQKDRMKGEIVEAWKENGLGLMGQCNPQRTAHITGSAPI